MVVEWLRTGGATISQKVDVRDLAGRGRGVIALEAVKKGEVIARLKRNQLLNFETIGHKGDPEIRSLRTKLPGPLLLAYYLYRYHDDEKNYWYDFMQSLPTKEELSTMPLIWEPKQRAALPEKVLEKVRTQYDQFTSDSDKVKALVEDLDLEKFQWAWMCVNTRCIYMDIPGTSSRKDKVTLAPFADFLNHTPDRESSVKIQIDGRGLVIYSTVDYKKDEEIYLSYGAHENATLLIEYGFVLHENEWDSVDVSTAITSRLRPGHTSVLYALNYVGDQFTINVKGPSFRTQMAIAALLEPKLNTESESVAVPARLQKLAEGEGDTDLYPDYYKFLDEIISSTRRKLDRTRAILDRRPSGGITNESHVQVVTRLVDGYYKILDTSIGEK